MWGEEEIHLAGEIKLNLLIDNTFRFYNLFDENALADRQKGIVKATKFNIGLLIVGLIVGMVIGFICNVKTPAVNGEFTNAGMTITLGNEFAEIKNNNYDFAY